MARKDYKVNSLDALTSSLRWSISFSELRHLDTTSENLQSTLMQCINGKSKSVPYSQHGFTLSYGEDNSIHATESETGESKWSVSFTSPPITMFAFGNGDESVLALDNFQKNEHSSSVSEFWKKKDSKKSTKVLVVGSFSSGSLYALPAPQMFESETQTLSGMESFKITISNILFEQNEIQEQDKC